MPAELTDWFAKTDWDFWAPFGQFLLVLVAAVAALIATRQVAAMKQQASEVKRGYQAEAFVVFAERLARYHETQSQLRAEAPDSSVQHVQPDARRAYCGIMNQIAYLSDPGVGVIERQWVIDVWGPLIAARSPALLKWLATLQSHEMGGPFPHLKALSEECGDKFPPIEDGEAVES